MSLITNRSFCKLSVGTFLSCGSFAGVVRSGEFKKFRLAQSSLNGDRTRISALRGLRPKPLDDKAKTCLILG